LDLAHRAPVAQYEQQAQALFEALRSGDETAAWRFQWEHPRFRGKPATDGIASSLTIDDARTVVASEHAFETWANPVAFTESVSPGRAVDRFEVAVEAVVAGDVARLRDMLREDPDLVRARSTRRHHATLLHYVGANGVEAWRQKTPAQAVETARLLLDAGAEVDALADLYGARCTTMSMLLSSSHPAEAGLQVALAETLFEYGAAPDGAGTRWSSPLMTALTFGFLGTARALAQRGVPADTLPIAAGLGRVDDTARLLPDADAEAAHIALALACQFGHTEVVRLLLQAGEDPNRYNPPGFHPHATPLHHAALNGHLEVVQLLLESGADPNPKDTIYGSTPCDWATHGGRAAVADYLRDRGATGRRSR